MRIPVTKGSNDPVGYLTLNDSAELTPNTQFVLVYSYLPDKPTKIRVHEIVLTISPEPPKEIR